MLRIPNIFFRWSTTDAIKAELQEAQHGLLRAQAGLEWAQAMVAYHQARINRLTTYLPDTTDRTASIDSTDPHSSFPSWNVRGTY